MPHADLLAALLPPVSYAPSGPHLAASLAMEGRELDRVQADAAHAVGGLAGVADVVITAPAANVQPTDLQWCRLGTLTLEAL